MTKILPLQKRLDRLKDGQAAHLDYDAAVIRHMGEIEILQYIGDDDAFCELLFITEVKDTLSYQRTAEVISDLARANKLSQEDIQQTVSILSAPAVRVAQAYDQRNTALLPYSRLRKTSVQRESLDKRLAAAKPLAGPPYNCSCMPIRRFFQAAAKLTRNPYFLNIYRSRILPLTNPDTLFREAVLVIDSLEEPERTDLLFKIFVEAFAALQSSGTVPERKGKAI